LTARSARRTMRPPIPIHRPEVTTEVSTVRLIEYDEAGPGGRALYDAIMATRKSDWVNNFWKALAVHPPTLRQTWERVKAVMAPGALDVLTKEMLYLAVSAADN